MHFNNKTITSQLSKRFARTQSFRMALPMLVLFAAPLPAATLGLCNTGFTVGCSALINNLVANQADGNYFFTNVGNPNNPSTVAFVVTTSPTTPDPLPSPWIPDDTRSQWIAPNSNVQFGGPFCCASGLYDYRINFTTTLANEVVSGRWATDNSGDLKLDGGATLSSSGSFTSWTNFTFNVAGAGAHSLDFQVTNVSNASGLRVEFNGTPEPDSMGLLATGLAAMAVAAKRKLG